MNGALVLATIRQLVSQPVRTGALLGCALLPLLQLAVDPDPRLGTSQWAIFIAVIAVAGIIGLEVSTGSLALFFTRPLTRFAYVLSRWAGAAAVASALVVLSLTAEVALLVARDAEVGVTAVLMALADRISVVIGIVSVMTFFSAMASSLGDLVIWIAINIVAMSLGASGEAAAIPLLTDAGHVLRGIANPGIDSFRLLSSMRLPWSHPALYLATVLLAIGLAGVVLNRKELSYASE